MGQTQAAANTLLASFGILHFMSILHTDDFGPLHRRLRK